MAVGRGATWVIAAKAAGFLTKGMPGDRVPIVLMVAISHRMQPRPHMSNVVDTLTSLSARQKHRRATMSPVQTS